MPSKKLTKLESGKRRLDSKPSQVTQAAHDDSVGAAPQPGIVDLDSLHTELLDMKAQISELAAEQAEMLHNIFQVCGGISASVAGGTCPKVVNNVSRVSSPRQLAVAIDAEPTNDPSQSEEALQAMGLLDDACLQIPEPSAPLKPNLVSVCSVPNKRRISDNSHKAPVMDRVPTTICGQEEIERRMASIIHLAEQQEHIIREAAAIKAQRGSVGYWIEWCKRAPLADLDMAIDSAMGFVICLNAIFIGLSMDHGSDGLGMWYVFDVLFTVIFLSELLIKIRMHGFCGHFCGAQSKSNIFDTSLIMIDCFQTLFVLIAPDAHKSMDNAPSASLFRVIRLVKLLRLIRLLRNDVFKDLMSMIQGMLGGVHTLGWAMVLFFITLYVIALFFRETLGRKQFEGITSFFDSVPRSIYTTFRCSFGDCSTDSGTPIFEHVHNKYGGLHTLFYCTFLFGMSIGLFNVISAIFVESTMAAAMALQTSKLEARLKDDKLWSAQMKTLIKVIMDVSPDYSMPAKMSDSLEEICKVCVTKNIIDAVVQEKEAVDALDALDLDPRDYSLLSDILDPDNSGDVPMADFVDGIRRLRGEPRRSDIVSVDLMIRSVQVTLQSMSESINSMRDIIVPS